MKKLIGILFFAAILNSCGQESVSTSDLANGEVWFGYCVQQGSGRFVSVGGQPVYRFTCGKIMAGSSKNRFSEAQADAQNFCRRTYGSNFILGNRGNGQPGMSGGDLSRDRAEPYAWARDNCHTLQDPR